MGTRLERRRDVAIIQTRNDSDPNSDEDERQGEPRRKPDLRKGHRVWLQRERGSVQTPYTVWLLPD